jgi:hypothetical protein
VSSATHEINQVDAPSRSPFANDCHSFAQNVRARSTTSTGRLTTPPYAGFESTRMNPFLVTDPEDRWFANLSCAGSWQRRSGSGSATSLLASRSEKPFAACLTSR